MLKDDDEGEWEGEGGWWSSTSSRKTQNLACDSLLLLNRVIALKVVASE